MAKVDFYVLNASGDVARSRFACRLAEKAFKLRNTVHIQTTDRARAAQLDELLWTFRDGSFVPHEIVDGGAPTPDVPVTIGFTPDCPRSRDLLINLTDVIPPAAADYPRVAEIVTTDEDVRQRSRQHFVDYRNNGHTLDTHKL